jgi:SET domain-containing protein
MSHQLYVKKIKGKGRGVFCREKIMRDEVIEICPVIVLPAADHDTAVSSRLSDYFFNFVKEENTLALALGFGSLYNHAVMSNAAYQLDRENRTMIYYALEEIPAGSEICINYAGQQGISYTEWFESRNIIFRDK